MCLASIFALLLRREFSLLYPTQILRAGHYCDQKQEKSWWMETI